MLCRWSEKLTLAAALWKKNIRRSFRGKTEKQRRREEGNNKTEKQGTLKAQKPNGRKINMQKTNSEQNKQAKKGKNTSRKATKHENIQTGKSKKSGKSRKAKKQKHTGVKNKWGSLLSSVPLFSRAACSQLVCFSSCAFTWLTLAAARWKRAMKGLVWASLVDGSGLDYVYYRMCQQEACCHLSKLQCNLLHPNVQRTVTLCGLRQTSLELPKAFHAYVAPVAHGVVMPLAKLPSPLQRMRHMLTFGPRGFPCSISGGTNLHDISWYADVTKTKSQTLQDRGRWTWNQLRTPQSRQMASSISLNRL